MKLRENSAEGHDIGIGTSINQLCTHLSSGNLTEYSHSESSLHLSKMEAATN